MIAFAGRRLGAIDDLVPASGHADLYLPLRVGVGAEIDPVDILFDLAAAAAVVTSTTFKAQPW